MKKLLLLILLFLPVQFISAEELDHVYLDFTTPDKYQYKNSMQNIENASIKEEETEDYIYNPMKYIKDEAKELFFNRDSEK